jgi:HAD superfamily hydrolase (TIGR01509 family)
MIKLVVFDLDGVLIDSKQTHYEALNRALGSEYAITIEEHLSTYDGLPTRSKLNMLSERKGLPTDCHAEIARAKQKHTVEILKETVQPRQDFVDMCREIKDRGYTLACASNAVRDTVKMSLLQLGIIEYFDFWYSNEDVHRPKPHFEMYFECMLKADAKPNETLIIEDSHIGRQAVLDAGAHLLAVADTHDVSLAIVLDAIEQYNDQPKKRIPWKSKSMNILIPMAGAGSRFAEQGYTFPKPLIEVGNKPMIQVVVDNLNIQANYIFIVQKAHYEKYNLETVLNMVAPGCTIVQTEGITEGAACTTLLAKEHIDNEEPLIIANSDQFVEWNSNEVLYAFTTEGVDGGILCFNSTHPKWSYAKLDDDGFVSEVAEKQPISTNATVGIYYWSRGSLYVNSAERMIERDIRTNNEFYVCPAYNELVEDGGKIRVKTIEEDGMWGLGTPEDLKHFLSNYKGKY